MCRAAHALQTVGEAVAAREEEERGNAMKALENRTLDSKKEMDIMDALEELIVSTASPAQHCRRPQMVAHQLSHEGSGSASL